MALRSSCQLYCHPGFVPSLLDVRRWTVRGWERKRVSHDRWHQLQKVFLETTVRIVQRVPG